MDLTNNICIGLMSGTSLDGLDIVAVSFEDKNGKLNYDILSTATFPFPETLEEQLRQAPELSGLQLTILDHFFGQFLGNTALEFIKKEGWEPSDILCIASHGQTIFHQPEKGFTLQIGHGADIAQITGCTVVNDFRIQDVVNGGQGAPLVPIGDRLLFSEYEACINLGGFSNISFDQNGTRIAFDICPCNLPLNTMAKFWGKKYDKNGEIAAQGSVDKKLLQVLNALPFYTQKHPKSLGSEWLSAKFETLFEYQKSENLMATLVEHIASQIGNTLKENKIHNALITGGGAYNKTLINRIKNYTDCEIIVPNAQLIESKEALIFALLGWLRINKKINTLYSVTGSISDGCHGIIHES